MLLNFGFEATVEEPNCIIITYCRDNKVNMLSLF